jgi:hypothetical protein
MGNTASSGGLFFGSILGGIIMGPLTGGASIVALSAIAGAGIGATSAVVNGALNRHSENPEKDLLIGAGCGMLGPICGGATKFGADVAYSVGGDILGKTIGVGYTSNEGKKPEPFIGNTEVVVKEREQQRQKEQLEKIEKQQLNQVLNKQEIVREAPPPVPKGRTSSKPSTTPTHPPLSSTDKEILSMKTNLKTEISSIKTLQQELLMKAFLWVDYDLKQVKRLERAKQSMVKIVVALGEIGKQYRDARIGGASRIKSYSKTLDKKPYDIYDVIDGFIKISREYQKGKKIYEDLVETANKHKYKILKELKDYDKIMDVKLKLKSDLKDYELVSEFFDKLIVNTKH